MSCRRHAVILCGPQSAHSRWTRWVRGKTGRAALPGPVERNGSDLDAGAGQHRSCVPAGGHQASHLPPRPADSPSAAAVLGNLHCLVVAPGVTMILQGHPRDPCRSTFPGSRPGTAGTSSTPRGPKQATAMAGGAGTTQLSQQPQVPRGASRGRSPPCGRGAERGSRRLPRVPPEATTRPRLASELTKQFRIRALNGEQKRQLLQWHMRRGLQLAQ